MSRPVGRVFFEGFEFAKALHEEPQAGGTSTVVIELGYTIADIIAKVGVGILIYIIAVRKSEAEYGSPVRAG